MGGLGGYVPALDDSGQMARPLVVVDLDSGVERPAVERAVASARASGQLLVGVASGELPAWPSPLVETLDLTLAASGEGPGCVAVSDPEAEVAALSKAVADNPQASLVLGQVLRITEGLPVPAALEVESLAYSTLLGGREFGRWLDGRDDRPLPPPVTEPVAVRRDGERMFITLNRPERRNAYGRQLRDALTDALRVALLDPAITWTVLDGAGPCFCSGGDLAEFGTAPDLATAHFIRTRAGAAPFMHDLRDRIEVRMHGSCVGAGVELAAFAGAVTAAEGTTFRLPEVGMGLIPGAGGTVSVPRRIGRWRTLYLALTGRAIDTSTALDWGLIDSALLLPGDPEFVTGIFRQALVGVSGVVLLVPVPLSLAVNEILVPALVRPVKHCRTRDARAGGCRQRDWSGDGEGADRRRGEHA